MTQSEFNALMDAWLIINGGTYISAYTGQEIDEAIGDVATNTSNITTLDTNISNLQSEATAKWVLLNTIDSRSNTNTTNIASLQTVVDTKAPINHASTESTYGISSSTNYGHSIASSATPLIAGTANVGTDNGKFAREGHVHPIQTSVTGNAGTANTLANAQFIGLSGVTATAQSFNGSASITIPITAVPTTLLTGTLPIINGGTGSTTATAALTALGAAPVSHASTTSTYGLGTTANYGHVMTINTLTQSNHVDGYALSAYQGYLLNTNKANLSSPVFTNIPTAPTAAVGTNTTQIATTAFVENTVGTLNTALAARLAGVI